MNFLTHYYRYCSLIAICCLLLLSGCTLTQPSAESRYYMLAGAPLKPPQPVTAVGPVYVVGPLNFAEYLQRSSVVTRLSENEYEVAKLEQWGGKIEDEFQIALFKDLSALLPEKRFFRYPSLVNLPDVTSLRADILRFDCQLNGDARLEVSWAWVRNNDIIAAGTFSQSAPAGNSTAAAVAAQSALVQAFAETLVQELNR